jgi:hypothetical protein
MFTGEKIPGPVYLKNIDVIFTITNNNKTNKSPS